MFLSSPADVAVTGSVNPLPPFMRGRASISPLGVYSICILPSQAERGGSVALMSTLWVPGQTAVTPGPRVPRVSLCAVAGEILSCLLLGSWRECASV